MFLSKCSPPHAQLHLTSWTFFFFLLSSTHTCLFILWGCPLFILCPTNLNLKISLPLPTQAKIAFPHEKSYSLWLWLFDVHLPYMLIFNGFRRQWGLLNVLSMSSWIVWLDLIFLGKVFSLGIEDSNYIRSNIRMSTVGSFVCGKEVITSLHTVLGKVSCLKFDKPTQDLEAQPSLLLWLLTKSGSVFQLTPLSLTCFHGLNI